MRNDIEKRNSLADNIYFDYDIFLEDTPITKNDSDDETLHTFDKIKKKQFRIAGSNFKLLK